MKGDVMPTGAVAGETVLAGLAAGLSTTAQHLTI